MTSNNPPKSPNKKTANQLLISLLSVAGQTKYSSNRNTATPADIKLIMTSNSEMKLRRGNNGGLSEMIHGHMQIIILIIKEQQLTFYYYLTTTTTLVYHWDDEYDCVRSHSHKGEFIYVV